MNNSRIRSPILTREIEQKLDKIADSLFAYPKNEEILNLMGGKAGIALFWAYYSEFSNRYSRDETLGRLISEIFEGLRKVKILPSFASGLSGIGWTIEHLTQNEYINIDTDSLIGNFDDLLYSYMIKFIKSGNYDYLHGGLGIGLYFLKRYSNPKNKRYIAELIDELLCHAFFSSDRIFWESTMWINREKKVCNLSLAHGLASIICVLCQFYTENIQTQKIFKLVEGAVNFLLQFKHNPKLSKYRFPEYVLLAEPQKAEYGRLSWCKGDLGISIALLQAGCTFGQDLWKKEAIETLINTTNITENKDTGIIDAGLCHGASGIAHIYNRAFHYTGLQLFSDTSNFWIEKCLKMAIYDDGLAGYKVMRSYQNEGMENNFGLMEGNSGIGLAMLAYVSDIEPAWDQAFLLS
jgi:lantibiotic modifying enzyme